MMRLDPVTKFLFKNEAWAQSHANASREAVCLFRDPTNRPRLMLVGWPSPKSWHLVATVRPQPSKTSAAPDRTNT